MKTVYAAIIAATALSVLPTVSDAQTATPLVLEYKLGTHVEAVARKYGQLDTFAKACNLPEYWNFEESSLVDLIGDNLTDSTIGTARRSYAEGQKLKTPPCDQSSNFIGLLVEQVERHHGIIRETSEQLRATQGKKNVGSNPETVEVD